MIETPYAQWQRIHRDHPLIWKMFRDFTFKAIRAGKQHFSSKAVFERMRWESEVVQGLPEHMVPDRLGNLHKVRLSNNCTAYYARLFVGRYSEHQHFFRFREPLMGEPEDIMHHFYEDDDE